MGSASPPELEVLGVHARGRTCTKRKRVLQEKEKKNSSYDIHNERKNWPFMHSKHGIEEIQVFKLDLMEDRCHETCYKSSNLLGLHE